MNKALKEAIGSSVGPVVVLFLAVPHLILRAFRRNGFFTIVHTHQGGDPTDAFIFYPPKQILAKKTN